MKKCLKIVCCFLMLLGCKEPPTFNPFDNQFDLDKSQFADLIMDTTIVGCGFYNLHIKSERFSPYYQFVFEENDLQAKGFSFIIDTIFGSYMDIDSIDNLNFRLEEANTYLKRFNKEIYRKEDQLLINHEDSTKIITLQNYNYSVNDSTWVRSIDFFIAPKSEY